jgi:hypothetical protein
MAFRKDLPFFQIFSGVFQDFDHGEVVEDWVPAEWNLKPGDLLEYEAGQSISGTAEVVDVVGTPEDGRIECTFKKIC